jgi:hypothetical protein
MFVCCECCVLSGSSLCDGLITRLEESYRLWCVVVCDLETSRMRRPWPALGRSASKKKSKRGYSDCNKWYWSPHFRWCWIRSKAIFWDNTKQVSDVWFRQFKKRYRYKISQNRRRIPCRLISLTRVACNHISCSSRQDPNLYSRYRGPNWSQFVPINIQSLINSLFSICVLAFRHQSFCYATLWVMFGSTRTVPVVIDVPRLPL